MSTLLTIFPTTMASCKVNYPFKHDTMFNLDSSPIEAMFSLEFQISLNPDELFITRVSCLHQGRITEFTLRNLDWFGFLSFLFMTQDFTNILSKISTLFSPPVEHY